jgi:hypothetical protein
MNDAEGKMHWKLSPDMEELWETVVEGRDDLKAAALEGD